MDLLEEHFSTCAGYPERYGRPLVTLSYAQSLDGSLTARRGRPLAISCPESLQLTHRLRAAHDAIMVGIGTILADDPRLDVRRVSGEDPQPIVLDSRLRMPRRAVLLRNSHHRPWIITTAEADRGRQESLEEAGARVFRLAADPDGRVDVIAALSKLADLGIGSLMVEGGAQVITSFLFNELVDRAVITLAPTLVGGQRAVERLLLQDEGKPTELAPNSISSFPRLREVRYEKLGTDLVVWGTLCRGDP